jgi:chaperonin cofactor prefoldin
MANKKTKPGKEELEKQLQEVIAKIKKLQMQKQHVQQQLIEADREAHRLDSILSYLE